MRRIVLLVSLAALALAATACNKVTYLTDGTGSNTKPVAKLWSDVPKMDGLSPSQMDLPLPNKLIMQTVIGSLGRLSGPGQDQTTGNLDWIVFTTTRSADEIKSFYTPERMATNGWKASDQAGCFTSGNLEVPDVAAFCVLEKQQGSEQTYLAIVASQDSQTKQTNLFFFRLQAVTTPTPGQ